MYNNHYYDEQRSAAMIECRDCSQLVAVVMTQEQYERMSSPNRRNIREIIPDVAAPERELFISGTCRKCWAEIFRSEDTSKD